MREKGQCAPKNFIHMGSLNRMGGWRAPAYWERSRCRLTGAACHGSDWHGKEVPVTPTSTTSPRYNSLGTRKGTIKSRHKLDLAVALTYAIVVPEIGNSR